MDDREPKPQTLAGVRERIDEIDEALLELLRERFAASHAVKALKSGNGDLTSTPIRPAREALLMRRLLDLRQDPLPSEVMVRLWRLIVTSSTLVQADARVHCSQMTNSLSRLRDMISIHYGQIPIMEHDSDADAIAAAAAGFAAIAIVVPDSGWLSSPGVSALGKRQVIGTLPFFDGDGRPDLLVIGEAFDEPTGQDETLIYSTGRLPRDFDLAPLWELELTGGGLLTSLPGFLSGAEAPLVGVKQGNDALALTVLGRYPSPINIEQ